MIILISNNDLIFDQYGTPLGINSHLHNTFQTPFKNTLDARTYYNTFEINLLECLMQSRGTAGFPTRVLTTKKQRI
jgi:hypothetical protein